MQIHSPNAVIVGLVAAVPAAEKMQFLITVCPFRMAAFRAGLACIRRIYLSHKLTVLKCLVKQFLLQVIIRPGYRNIPVFDGHSFCCRPDAFQVFNNEQSAFGVGLDECLRDAVVYVLHPTVFSLADGLDPSS